MDNGIWILSGLDNMTTNKLVMVHVHGPARESNDHFGSFICNNIIRKIKPSAGWMHHHLSVGWKCKCARVLRDTVMTDSASKYVNHWPSLPLVSWLRHTWVCLVYGNFYVKLWAACGRWPGTQTIRASLTSPWPWLLLRIIIWIITMMMITNRRYYPKISGYLTQVIFGDRISPRYQPPTMTHLILQQPAAGPHRPWLLTTGPH